MTTNHRNRSWRRLWVIDHESRTALHKSGVLARAAVSPTDPEKDKISLENTDKIDPARWNLGKLTEQAVKLWVDGDV